MLADNAHERENEAPVFRIARHRSAGIFPGRENAQVIAFAVTATLGTGWTAGGDLGAGILDLLKAGEIEV